MGLVSVFTKCKGTRFTNTVASYIQPSISFIQSRMHIHLFLMWIKAGGLNRRYWMAPVPTETIPYGIGCQGKIGRGAAGQQNRIAFMGCSQQRANQLIQIVIPIDVQKIAQGCRQRPERLPVQQHAPGLGIPHQRLQGQLRSVDAGLAGRSEEHTSELQSPCNLVCRLLLEKKKKKKENITSKEEIQNSIISYDRLCGGYLHVLTLLVQ